MVLAQRLQEKKTKMGEIIQKHSPIVKEPTILPGIFHQIKRGGRVDQEEGIAWIRYDFGGISVKF